MKSAFLGPLEEIRFTQSEITKSNSKTARGCQLKIKKYSIQNASKFEEPGNESAEASKEAEDDRHSKGINNSRGSKVWNERVEEAAKPSRKARSQGKLPQCADTMPSKYSKCSRMLMSHDQRKKMVKILPRKHKALS